MTARALAAIAVISALAPAARAETRFEDAAAQAARTPLDEVVWALTAACDSGDDVRQRQCRQLRDARAKALAGATIVTDADPTAFSIGAWHAQRKSVTVALMGCVRCGGIRIDDRTWHVTASGAPRVEAGALRAAALHDSARTFPDEAAAAAWTKSVAGARVQLVLKVPARPRWQVAGKDGLALELVAYRVITPCNGAVVIASPGSGPAAPDKQACGAPAR